MPAPNLRRECALAMVRIFQLACSPSEYRAILGVLCDYREGRLTRELAFACIRRMLRNQPFALGRFDRFMALF